MDPLESQNVQAAPTASPATPPSEKEADKVWMTREEYEALRARAIGPSFQAYAPQQTGAGQPRARKDSPAEIGSGIVIALLLYASVAYEFMSWAFVPAIIGLIVYAAIYFMSSRTAANAATNAPGPAYSSSGSTGSTALKAMGGVALLLLLSPVIALIALWLFFTLIFASSGGRGS